MTSLCHPLKCESDDLPQAKGMNGCFVRRAQNISTRAVIPFDVTLSKYISRYPFTNLIENRLSKVIVCKEYYVKFITSIFSTYGTLSRDLLRTTEITAHVKKLCEKIASHKRDRRSSLAPGAARMVYNGKQTLVSV